MKRFQGHAIRGPKTMWCYAAGQENPKVAKPVFHRNMEMVLKGQGPKWHCSNCKEEAR